MAKAARFIHIADSHVGADPSFANYGHLALDNLLAVVEEINALPFPVDFVLHAGDIVEDGSEPAYRLAREVLGRLRFPLRIVPGNHDDTEVLARIFGRHAAPGARMDDVFDADGVQVAVFDTLSPRPPSGTLTDAQLDSLRALCVPEGPPLVVALHHPPLALDTAWLDTGWDTDRGRTHDMLLDRGPEFRAALLPARQRIRGVFFGHVHRAFQVVRDGILYSSAPSTFGQLRAWPSTRIPEPSPEEPAGFNLVTVTPEATTVRQYSIARPRSAGTQDR